MASRAPRATPTPTAAPEQQILDAPAGAQPPAKRSKLAVAMDTVTAHMTAMEALGVTIAEVERSYPKDHVFAVATKEGYKLADKVRADARKSRLHVADMRKQGTALLNGLKEELWAVADPQIARLQAIEDNAKAQVDAHDAKEEKRKNDLRERVAAIGRIAQGIGTMTSEQIAARMTEFEAVVVDDTFAEFKEAAAKMHAETKDTLTTAFAATVQREQEEAAQRAREAKQSAARMKIAHWKALPDQHEESDVEALAEVLATIPPRDDDAEKYGDMAEFVDMARDKCLTVLQAMHKAAVDTREEQARQARVQMTASPLGAEEAGALADRIEGVLDADLVRRHAADDGAEVLAPQDGENSIEAPEAGLLSNLPHDEPPADEEDPFSVESMQRAARATIPALAETPAATPAPAPTVRTVRVTRAAPAPTPAPAPAPSTELSVEPEVPDLLDAARVAVAAWSLLDETMLPASAIAALRNLRAAVDFTTEFAD